MIVTGPPASGKSTLAADLAPRLGLTLLRKDDFKEALFERHGGSVPLRRLSDLAWDELFERAAGLGPVLIEGNLPVERAGDVAALHPSPLEIFCRADPTVLVERLSRRRRHEVHDDEALRAEVRSGVVRGARPLGVGRVIEVRTDLPVDVSSLVVEIGRHLAS